LYSIRFDGRDKRTVFSGTTPIHEFDILGDYIYWIEYNGNHFIRANLSETQTIRKELSVSENINRFQIVHYWKQPNGTNRCLNSNCSELCLPVDERHYRCCQHQICFENQELQTVPELLDISTIDQTINSSLSTIPSINTNTLETTNSHFRNDENNNNFSSINTSVFTEILANEEKQNTILETQTIIITDPSINKSDMNTDKEYRSTTNQNSLKNFEKYSNDQNNENNLKLIAKNKTNDTNVEILSNNTEIVIKIDELKEYEKEISISWIHLIIYGTIILISGIFLGSILSTLTIRLYGKQKWSVIE
jgi:hypothetical protein